MQEALLDHLNDKERAVITALYTTTEDNRERTKQEVAVMLGMSVAGVSRTHNAAIRKLQQRVRQVKEIRERMGRRKDDQ
jgi:DNA-directed RNA polymerase specialized sigma subunit